MDRKILTTLQRADDIVFLVLHITFPVVFRIEPWSQLDPETIAHNMYVGLLIYLLSL